MSDQITQYELDMSEPGEPDRPKRRRTARVSRQGLGIAIAFALGVLVGAAGLDKHYDSSAARSRNSEVSLIAVLGTLADPERLTYEVRVFNDGPLPVRIDDAALRAPGYEAEPVDTEPERTHAGAIAPGEWATLTPSVGVPACMGRNDSSGPALTIKVTTANEVSRAVEIPLLDQHRELDSMRNAECEAIQHPERMVFAYADGYHQDDEQGSRLLRLRIESQGRRSVQVVGLEPAGDLEIRLLEPLPIILQPRSWTVVEMEIIAIDCTLLKGPGPHLIMTVRRGDAIMDHEVWLDPYTFGMYDLGDDCETQGRL